VRGTAPSVVRVKGGKAEKVQIQVGVTDKASETVEVLSGLQAGHAATRRRARNHAGHAGEDFRAARWNARAGCPGSRELSLW
jgi:hypothetical protein